MPLSVTVDDQLDAAAPGALASRSSSRTAPRSVNFTALSMRFSSAARSRTASPTSISGKTFVDAHRALKPLVSARAAAIAPAPRSAGAAGKSLAATAMPPGFGFGRIDHQRGQRRQMLGARLDAGRPAPLALAEIRARQQFAEREDAGERGADIVREAASTASDAHASARRGFAATESARAADAPAVRAGFAAPYFFLFARAHRRAIAAATRRRHQHAMRDQNKTSAAKPINRRSPMAIP